MDDIPSTFKLNQEDKQSTLWQRLKDHLEEEIESLRKRNDRLEISEREADQIRGSIAALKNLLQKGQ